MMRLIKIGLIFLVLPLSMSCKDGGAGADGTAAFTLQTGLDSELGMCTEVDASSVSIQDFEGSQMVKLFWGFPCGAEIEQPYLTVARNGRATLVVNSDYGKNSCECIRGLTVKINNRLKIGETLYVVVNKEVVGHKLLGASDGSSGMGGRAKAVSFAN